MDHGSPARLSRAAIVRAALTLVDTMGAARFTMRQLGSTLGVQAMSVYRYFPSRRAVLDAVVDTVGAETTTTALSGPAADSNWRTYLEQVARSLRQLTVTHPKLFLLVASHPAQAPWLRPPLRTVEEVDTFARRLIDDHFSPTATAAAYKRFTAFLLGHLLCEVTARGGATSALQPGKPTPRPTHRPAAGVTGGVADSAADVTAAIGYPHAAAMAKLLGGDTGRDDDPADFEAALRQALDDLAILRDD